MTKREARKVVLRFVADSLRADVANGSPVLFGDVKTDEDERKICAEVERLANHLEWEANGRPERP
jgi:hypothetical protein